MKRKEVLRLLRVTPQTLTKYVKTGLIKVFILPNGRYDYDDSSVFEFSNKGIQRKCVLYARVLTSKQKKDLESQIELLKNHAFQQGRQINAVYKDIASEVSFDDRKEFLLLLDEIIAGKISEVIVTYKDRLSRMGFDLLKYLFSKYGTEITVISEVG